MTDTHRGKSISDQTREHVIAVAIIFVVEIRLNGVVGAIVKGPVNFDQLFGMWNRQGPQQHRVHQTKDCGVGADAEREGNYRDSREARPLQKIPESVADVSY